MGTDVRKAIYDGFPASQVIACDLLADFIALGHKLYDDKDACPIHFFTADIFAVPLSSSPVLLIPSEKSLSDISTLSDLLGRTSIVYAGALFHLFDESTQHALALRIALLFHLTVVCIALHSS